MVSSISGRRIHEAPYGVRPAKPTPPTSRFSAYIGAMSRTGCFQPGYIMSQRWIFRPIFGNTLAGSKSICTFAIVIGKMTVSKIKQASTLNRCLFVLKRVIQPRGGTETGRPLFLHAYCLTLMKRRTRPRSVRISVRVEVAKLVKVKAYYRQRKGKRERVRSHYRRY